MENGDYEVTDTTLGTYGGPAMTMAPTPIGYGDIAYAAAQQDARAYELDRITKREAGYAGYRCGTLQHYFECSHAESCNCGRVVLKTSKVDGCL